MLVLFLFVALYAALSHLLEYPFKRAIKKGKTVRESIEIRESIKVIRVIVQGLCFVTFLGLEIYASFGEGVNSESVRNFVMSIVLLITFLRQNYKSEDILGNISTITKAEYLYKTPRYILYLRGFEADDYRKEEKFNGVNEFPQFTEYPFMEILQEYTYVCAVGMTKEIDCPHGATRIYLSDETWKEDVGDLMKKAKKIVVLVDNRESCIWEIEQSLELLDKTVFLIDDVAKYNDVRNSLKDKIELPQLTDNLLHTEYESQSANHLYLVACVNGEWILKKYLNNRSDYQEIASNYLLEGL